MLDRRTLLKRMGIVGLAIPAAALVESQLVLPKEVATEIVKEPVGSYYRYQMKGIVKSLEFRRELIPDFMVGHRRYLPSFTTINMEIMSGSVNIEEVDTMQGELVTVTWVNHEMTYFGGR